ncbi:MAG TPA: carboxyl transferase domain-containing protein, partial [Lachnospiraceae bacterium]|nr:carboxyl transferase domain-containing protein [Lachnospiraceae bacterium]
ISDDNFFFEVKATYAKDMVTGFIRLNGMTIGAVANRAEVLDADFKVVEKMDSVLSTAGCDKATGFVNFCDAFNIPVLTLTSVTGYKATTCEEKTIAKAAAKLTYAFANATVPKVNVIVGDAFGSAYLTMNSKHIGADMVLAYEDVKIGMMEEKAAAQIMYAEEIKASQDATALINEKSSEYARLQSSVESAAKRGYVDNVITPESTRKQLVYAYEMLFTKRESRPSKKHGTV